MPIVLCARGFGKYIMQAHVKQDSLQTLFEQIYSKTSDNNNYLVNSTFKC
jgi:hypothetical protein